MNVNEENEDKSVDEGDMCGRKRLMRMMEMVVDKGDKCG